MARGSRRRPTERGQRRSAFTARPPAHNQGAGTGSAPCRRIRWSRRSSSISCSGAAPAMPCPSRPRPPRPCTARKSIARGPRQDPRDDGPEGVSALCIAGARPHAVRACAAVSSPTRSGWWGESPEGHLRRGGERGACAVCVRAGGGVGRRSEDRQMGFRRGRRSGKVPKSKCRVMLSRSGSGSASCSEGCRLKMVLDTGAPVSVHLPSHGSPARCCGLPPLRCIHAGLRRGRDGVDSVP